MRRRREEEDRRISLLHSWNNNCQGKARILGQKHASVTPHHNHKSHTHHPGSEPTVLHEEIGDSLPESLHSPFFQFNYVLQEGMHLKI
jgi:hypothetical protein